jgi:hypothetical protein
MRAMNFEVVDAVSGGQSDALTGAEVLVGVAVCAAAPLVAGVAAGAAIVCAGIAIWDEL